MEYLRVKRQLCSGCLGAKHMIPFFPVVELQPLSLAIIFSPKGDFLGQDRLCREGRGRLSGRRWLAKPFQALVALVFAPFPPRFVGQTGIGC